MIAQVRGILAKKTPDLVIVDISGVGYEVFITLNSFYKLPDVGEEVLLITHTHVREDCIQLFGFLDESEKRLFHLLLGVAKIGPRLAMNILSGITPNELREAITLGNMIRINQIPRVGKKTAERIIVELKDRVKDIPMAVGEEIIPVDDKIRKDINDAIEALIVLGYSRKEAEKVLDKVVSGVEEKITVENLLKKSLSLLAER